MLHIMLKNTKSDSAYKSQHWYIRHSTCCRLSSSIQRMTRCFLILTFGVFASPFTLYDDSDSKTVPRCDKPDLHIWWSLDQVFKSYEDRTKSSHLIRVKSSTWWRLSQVFIYNVAQNEGQIMSLYLKSWTNTLNVVKRQQNLHIWLKENQVFISNEGQARSSYLMKAKPSLHI